MILDTTSIRVPSLHNVNNTLQVKFVMRIIESIRLRRL